MALTNEVLDFNAILGQETTQSVAYANDDRWPVLNHLVSDAYWVKLTSTVHCSYPDLDFIVDSASLEQFCGTPTSGQFLPPARVSQVVRTYLLSFFNKYLKGEDDHLLDGPSGNYPEVIQFLKE